LLAHERGERRLL